MEEDVEAEDERDQEERNGNRASSRDGNNSDYKNHDDDADQDSYEGPRPAKRRKLFPSDSDPPSEWNRKRRLHRPHGEPDNTTSAASAALKSTDLGDPQLVDRVTGADQEWEIRSIIGRQKVDGVVQYWVEWEPTWMPESELMGARELVDEFEARLQAPCENKIEQGEADGTCETQPKRRRGRPWKKQ